MKSGVQRQSVFGPHANLLSIRILNRSDVIDSDHSLDATVFLRLSFGPWPRTRTPRPFFKFSCSNGSTARGTWPDFTSCRSNRRSSRIWRLCGVGVASGAQGVSASPCTRPGRLLRSSSRNGSIARGAADTSSERDGRRPYGPVARPIGPPWRPAQRPLARLSSSALSKVSAAKANELQGLGPRDGAMRVSRRAERPIGVNSLGTLRY